MVERAIEQYDVSIEMRLEDKNKMIKNVPGLIINDNVVSEGKVLSVREITRFIKNEVNC